MHTIKNPYQTCLSTNILHRKAEGETTRLVLEDTLLMDYEQLHLLPERAEIDGAPILRTYMQGDHLVHVVSGKPQKSRILLQVNIRDRRQTQRDVSLRLLLRYLLAQHENRNPYAYEAIKSISGNFQVSFRISGHFTQEEIIELQGRLDRGLERFLRSGLRFRSKEDPKAQTQLFGVCTLPWMGPHLDNCSEIYRYHWLSPRLCAGHAELTYRLD